MKTKVVLAAVLIMALLCSCGNVGQQTGEQGQVSNESTAAVIDSVDWVVSREVVLPSTANCEESIIPDGGLVGEILCALSEESIYRCVATMVRTEEEALGDTAYYIQKLEPPYEEWTIVDSIALDEWVEGDSCTVWWYPWSSVMAEAGQLSMILQGTEDTYLCGWTEETGHSVQKLEKKFVQVGSDDANSIESMYVNDAQGIFLTDSKGVLHGGVNQELSRISSGKNAVLQIVENPYQQQLYQAGNTATGGFYVQAMESEQPELCSDTVFMESGDIVIWSSETEGYLCNIGEVWKFSTERQEISRIMELSYQGRSLKRLLGAEATEDGGVRLLVDTGDKYVLMDLSENTEGAERVRLELATGQVTEILKQAVVLFNQTNNEYYVEIREPEEGVTWADFKTQIQAEISAGKGPDLLTDDVFINDRVEQTAEKKLLLELTEYFVEEGEAILSNAWESGKVGEDLYAVPYSCMTQTLVAGKSMVGERNGWTVEELMQCVRESGVEQFCPSFNASSLFWYLSREGGIIDWESGACHFDSETAEELLKFAEEYGGEVDYLTGDIKVIEGKALVSSAYLYGPTVFNHYLSILENGQVYVGYPTADGESGHVLYADMVGISQNTKYPEGAVAFLQYIISEDMQEYMAESMGSSYASNITGFPVRKDALEHLYEYLLNEPSEDGRDTGSIVYEYGPQFGIGDGEYIFSALPFTEDSVQQMRTVLETAQPTHAEEDELFDMIWEETEAYFAGDKEAKEVLAILQNRVQLYFDEMK